MGFPCLCALQTEPELRFALQLGALATALLQAARPSLAAAAAELGGGQAWLTELQAVFFALCDNTRAHYQRFDDRGFAVPPSEEVWRQWRAATPADVTRLFGGTGGARLKHRAL